ncbi:MAG TPA: YbhB/YbcL family Raf kinase inhibitor-like protein [Acidimicrobiia bacterium]|nr:YbhB/YbcL family Raf kinase inhibitor-like protein [Acidimicrobiia bacterium]
MRTTPANAAVAVLLLLAACGKEQTKPVTSDSTTTAPTQEGTMRLTSTAFQNQGKIPAEYTCDGEGASPPLLISGIPEGTVTLALVMDDPDAPSGTWDHWVAYDIDPTAEIPRDVGALGTAGVNTSGGTGYDGPCPPSGTHRYVHRVFALDIRLGLAEGASKVDVVEAMDGHVLAEATLTGLYR